MQPDLQAQVVFRKIVSVNQSLNGSLKRPIRRTRFFEDVRRPIFAAGLKRGLASVEAYQRGSCFPTLSAEESGKDGARSVVMTDEVSRAEDRRLTPTSFRFMPLQLTGRAAMHRAETDSPALLLRRAIRSRAASSLRRSSAFAITRQWSASPLPSCRAWSVQASQCESPNPSSADWRHMESYFYSP